MERENENDSRRVIAMAVAMSCNYLIFMLIHFTKMQEQAWQLFTTQAHSFRSMIAHLHFTAALADMHQMATSHQLLSILSFLKSIEAAAILTASPKRQGRWWMKPRTASSWFDNLSLGLLDDMTFKSLFRMSRQTFEWFCGEAGPHVAKMNTVWRESVPANKRLAAALFRLATGSKLFVVSQKFGIGEATAHKCTLELCKVLNTRFRHLIAFPSGETLARVRAGFVSAAGIPNCCGVLSCMRFRMKRPFGEHSSDYIDRKGHYSIAAQVVVDASTRVLSLATGFAGSIEDSRVLRLSSLFNQMQMGDLFPVPSYLVAGRGYPHLPWLIVPYSGESLPFYQDALNRKIEQLHGFADRTFIALKRWGFLGSIMKTDVRSSVLSIGACCVLHNLLLEQDDAVDEDDICKEQTRFSDEDSKTQDLQIIEEEGNEAGFDADVLAEEIRNDLALQLMQVQCTL